MPGVTRCNSVVRSGATAGFLRTPRRSCGPLSDTNLSGSPSQVLRSFCLQSCQVTRASATSQGTRQSEAVNEPEVWRCGLVASALHGLAWQWRMPCRNSDEHGWSIPSRGLLVARAAARATLLMLIRPLTALARVRRQRQTGADWADLETLNSPQPTGTARQSGRQCQWSSPARRRLLWSGLCGGAARVRLCLSTGC